MNVSHRWRGALLCSLLIGGLGEGHAAPGRDPFAPQPRPPCVDAAALRLGGILRGGDTPHAWLQDAAGRWQNVTPGVQLGTTGWRVEQIATGSVTLAADPGVCPDSGVLQLYLGKAKNRLNDKEI